MFYVRECLTYDLFLLEVLWCLLIAKSLSSFELIFVYDVKVYSNSTDLPAAVQLFQYQC